MNNGIRRCKVCGKEIPESRKSNNTKYCSEKCARDAGKTKDRIAKISKRAKNINNKKMDVYRCYNEKCAICGWQATKELIETKRGFQFAHGNEIHHIIPVTEGGNEEWGNLILLCPNHHKMADMGLISPEELKKHIKPFKEYDRLESSCERTIGRMIFG